MRGPVLASAAALLVALTILAGTEAGRVEVRMEHETSAVAEPVAGSGAGNQALLRAEFGGRPGGDPQISIEFQASARIELSADAACDFVTGSDGGCGHVLGTLARIWGGGGVAEVARIVGRSVTGWIRTALF